LKAYFATVLALLLLVQSFNHTMLVVHYALNRTAITREFCENKSKPLQQCNGKCHLAKELKKADEAEKKLPVPVKEKFEVLQFCIALPTFLFFRPTISASVYKPFHPVAYAPPDFGIFHPPRFLV
jgi:hypothetical protein